MATLPRVVGASSAFPGFFPPVEISAEDLGVREGQFPTESFTDGGVYDNLGTRAFAWLEEEVGAFDRVLVSDAGKPFQILGDQSLGFIGQSIRASDILWDRVWQLERENFGQQSGFSFLPTTEIVSRENLASMDYTMRKLADSTGSFGSRLAVINERATTINLAVTTIAKVADQTNLLSINAAIEAEKAGEYGLGFLVIAREIRRLADQTAVASLEIEKVVKEMQLSVSSGVMEMDAFTKSVETGAEEIGGVSRQLAEIITSVKGISERFEQVAEGMQAQSQGAEQIRIAMSHLAESVSESESALESFQNATTDVQQAANDLHGEITHFKL